VDLEPVNKLDLAIGGETSDVGVLGTLFAAPDPIIMYMVNGGLYKWGFSIRGVDLDRVNTLKFNGLGTKINAFITNSINWYVAVIQASDGALLKVIKSGDNRPGIFPRSGYHMLVDINENVYLGYLGVKPATSPVVNLLHLFRIPMATVTTGLFSSSLSITTSRNDATTRYSVS
jgi:hypothetical protein